MGKIIIYALAAILLFSGIPGVSYAYKFKLADVDWVIGGSARLDMGYSFSDLGSTPTSPAGQESKLKDWFLENPGNSRLNLRATYNDISAFYEIGIPTNSNEATGRLSTRHLYADYKINDSNSLLLGQTTSILAPLDPEQHLRQDKLLQGFGNLYPSRNPQFKYTYKNGGLTAAVALQDTRSVSSDFDKKGLSGSHVVEGYIPVLMAAVEYKNDMFMVMPSAYYQTYELKKNDALETSKSVNVASWAVALDGTVKTDIVLLAAEIWFGQNLSTWSIDQRSGSKKTTTMGAPVADISGNDIKNVDSMGGWLQVGVPIKPVTVYAGYGFQHSKVEKTDTSSIQYNDKIKTQAAFISAKWEVRNGFYVQPEIAWFDNGNDAQKTLSGYQDAEKTKPIVYADGDNKLGNDIYAGVHFQYDF